MNRRLVLSLAFLCMEALAFFVVGTVLTSAAGYEGMSFLAFLAAECGGFFLVRGLARVELPGRMLITIGGALTVLCLVTIIGLDFDPGRFPPGWAGLLQFISDPAGTAGAARVSVVYGVVLLVMVWGRGVYAAQQRLERGRALRSFSLGLIVLLAGLLFGQDSSARDAVNGASIPLVGFGLLTLALIHLTEARPEGGEPLRGPWLLIAGSTVAALILTGAAIGVFPLGPAGWLYDHAIGPALNLALLVVSWAVVIVAFPFAWIISQILSRVLGGRPLQLKPPTPVTGDNANPILNKHTQGGPAAVFVVLFKLIAILVVVAVIAYIAYRLFNRLHRPPAEGEERESLAGEGSLRADLAALWRSLRPRRPLSATDREPDLSPGVLEVRRLYMRLLDRAAHRGRPRPPAAAPIEFAGDLEQTFASSAPVHLSTAFAAGRYGLVEPTAAELHSLREELDGLG